MNNTSKARIVLYLLICAVLVVGVALVGWYFFLLPSWNSSGEGQSSASSTSTQENYSTAKAVFIRSQYQDSAAAYQQLMTSSPAFVKATQLTASGDFSGAVSQYKLALLPITDPAQQAVVQFSLASDEAATGDYAAAVAVYKKLAASTTTLSSMTRATAVEDLGHMYEQYGDPAITKEIFKDPPYNALYVSGNNPLTYRHLFDYASSIYPLTLSELYSATWYVFDLPYATSTRTQVLNTISKKLALADQGIAYLRGLPSQGYTLTNALERRAVILADLQLANYTGFADPEGAFSDLMNTFTTLGLTDDGTARLQYAYYLANRYGSSRAQDIQSLLLPIETNPSAHGKTIVPFLTNERENRLGSKPNLVLLAAIDPKFKSLLKSYGWTESDFAAN